MAILTKDALLAASDLREEELYLPSLGGSVRVRTLSAAYSNDAISQASSVENVRGEAVAKFSAAKLEELKVLKGLVEPKLDSLDEVHNWSLQIGPAWKAIVEKIDELSGLSKEAADATDRAFPVGGASSHGPAQSDGSAAGSNGSDQPVSVG